MKEEEILMEATEEVEDLQEEDQEEESQEEIVDSVEETEVVHHPSEVRQEVRDHLPAFATRLEIPEWLGDVARRTFEGNGRNSWRFLSMEAT